MAIERIVSQSRTVALIVRGEESEAGARFYTPDEYTLQMGKHVHPKGKIIKAHRHQPVKIQRESCLQEVLYIQQGKVKVTFYSEENRKFDEKVLEGGDLILLMEGGHGFEFLEPTKMLEIKQGPYMPDSKKTLDI